MSMGARKKILAANWKMNLTQLEAESYLKSFLVDLNEVTDVEVVIIPPFTALSVFAAASSKAQWIRLGAQNMHWEKKGAFTGEISAPMLRSLYVKYVVVGHSERRTLFGETDEIVNRKVRSALDAGLRPIMCVGETLQQRESGQENEVLETQVRQGLAGVDSKDFHDIVIAYEPVWAIGTGRTATPEQARDMHAHIRQIIASMADATIADRIRIQYGGSVKVENTEELMRQPGIDGALIGGASLDPRSFGQIIRKTEGTLK
jgi:triosephosphate isomerase (TIM)